MAGINVSDVEPMAWIVSGNALRHVLAEVKNELSPDDVLQSRLAVALEVGWLDLAKPRDVETERLADLVCQVSRRLVDAMPADATDYERKYAGLLAQLLQLLERRREGHARPPS